MKFPNINYITNKAKTSFIAYPTTILSAIIAVILSVYLIENQSNIQNKFPYINAILTFALGIPLFFCSTMINTRSTKSKYIFEGSIVLILTLIYFSLPNQNSTFNTKIPYIRYTIFNIIAHLIISFTLFLKSGGVNGFWNYNKTLFLRLCTAVLYSGFIYIGIILALTALHLLFDIDIDGKLYTQIFIVVFGLFNTWFFVAGISKNTDLYNNIKEYPKGLKIFSQYILLPLLATYLIILYAYSTKIIITQHLPKGIVSYLITIVSVLGIFAFLLIYPYGKQKGNEWIKKANILYYYLLLPLIFLLAIAIYLRIVDYGLTINRYMICLFGGWVLFLSIYFCLKKTNIKIIPTSLAFFLLLSSFGPWGMFSLSEKSQSKRLIHILDEHHFLEDGKVINEVVWDTDSLPKFYSKKKNIKTPVVSDSIHNEIKSILDYLDNHHGMNTLQPMFKQDLKSYLKTAADSLASINEAKIYMETLGLKYKHIYDFKTAFGEQKLKFGSKNQKTIQITNYDYLVDFHQYNYNSNPIDFTIQNEKYQLIFNKKKSILKINSATDTLDISLSKLTQQLYHKYPKGMDSIANHQLQLTGKINHFNVLFELKNMSTYLKNDSLNISNFNGKILLKDLNK
ncbi:hypothetical protein AXE80_04095 [Wenyingzhuangia fucanilytica]|uniref:DUF4153 domain-containing protein n=1 Tax=Wenyingzhuangia fucanilytica TaxID=1790137 RepID=A0A1B1Y411_9FLAO|nr:DUF4153 domain-containing protein [Wenyingzhuangia fucanilytica]ANW95510.1 hypothetical protein AXE80_04095 [Wenyingzhuangia fucanilytica]